MEGEVFIVTIVAIACATGLIRSWINRHKNSNQGVDEESFNRLARAFMQHKKEMQERVENLEAIIADEENNGEKHIYPEIENQRKEEVLTNDLRDKERSK